MTVTLDIIDSELSPHFAKYAALSDDDYLKIYERPVQALPRWWDRYHRAIAHVNFQWTEVKYEHLRSHLAQSTQADSPGLYIFVVKPPLPLPGTPSLAMPQYATYVGVAGETADAQRPLKERLKEYTYISEIRRRQSVHKVLQLYYPYLWVVYSPLSLPPGDLREIEVAMHGFLRPWASGREDPPAIQNAQRAWERPRR